MVYVQCSVCCKSIAKCAIKTHEMAHAKEGKCRQCGNVVPSYKKFCNTSCAAKYNNNRKGTGRVKPSFTCLYCGKEIKGRTGKFCNNTCGGKYETKKNVDKWIRGEIDGNRRRGESLCVSISRYLVDQANNKCQRCGWSEKHPISGRVPLTVHHIDGCSSHSRPENLIVLCPNCHSLTENYGVEI